ncbi:hypothetical protein [Streptomyces sp. NPDC085665]|uniref:hypothetical protein n=1 Tax=Streptomyces sp. NPDC085665 TaxID=3365735 RepID=UPI0037D1461A
MRARTRSARAGHIAAVPFFIAFLLNAADITTNDVLSSTSLMLIGPAALALRAASRRRRARGV